MTNIPFFPEQEFEDKCFTQCNFFETHFSNISFTDCQFTDCDFTLAKFFNTAFVKCSFKNCKMIGLNFGDCRDFLFSVRFEQCILDYALFGKMKMKKTPFIGCSLKEADFTETDLTEAVFDNCDLERAQFYNTNLVKADFLTSYNYAFDPDHNRICKARFSTEGLIGLLGKYEIEVV